MLIVDLRGRPKNISKKEIWDVLEFIEDEMGLKRYRDVFVELRFLKNFQKETGWGGWCIWEGDYIRPREFIIELDSAHKKESVIKGLIHEFAHVKQWVTGQMKDRGGRVWYEMYHGHNNFIPYHKRPWEKDARFYENKLYKKYKKHQQGDVVCNRHKEKNMSKTEKLLKVLGNGVELTTEQIQRKVGFSSPSAVNSAVRSLRSQGHCVYRNNTSSGVKYRLGAPSRRIISAAFATQGSEIFTR